MNLLMLTFITCGLLTAVTKAGWGVQRCWKNNVGHCRRRCLYFERYKALCMNKLNCCTPIKLDEYTPRPLPSLFPVEDFTGDFTWSISSGTPKATLNDEITIGPTKDTSVTKITASEKTTPTQPLTTPTQPLTTPTQPLTSPVSSNGGTTN